MSVKHSTTKDGTKVLTAPSADNVDYNELKNLIKVNTTKDQGQAIAIPGQPDTALAKFEDTFFNELYNQHDRVDLFVKSKADEIRRRLRMSWFAVASAAANIYQNSSKIKSFASSLEQTISVGSR